MAIGDMVALQDMIFFTTQPINAYLIYKVWWLGSVASRARSSRPDALAMNARRNLLFP
jgi:hypothetical protein